MGLLRKNRTQHLPEMLLAGCRGGYSSPAGDLCTDKSFSDTNFTAGGTYSHKARRLLHVVTNNKKGRTLRKFLHENSLHDFIQYRASPNYALWVVLEINT